MAPDDSKQFETCRPSAKASTPEEGEIQDEDPNFSCEREWDNSDVAWTWLLLAMYEILAGTDLPAALKAFDAALLLAGGSLKARLLI